MLSLLVALLAFQQPPAQKSCAACHVKPDAEWKASVHAANGIGCADCHGTDAVDEAKPEGQKHARGKDFLPGKDSANVALCAKCHQGVMDAFKKSQHFLETEDADSKMKGCISCHVPHGTTVADRRAIEKQNCSGCHKKATQMERKLMEAYCAQAESLGREVDRLKEVLRKDRPGVSTKEERETLEECAREIKRLRILQHNAGEESFKTLAKESGPKVKQAKDAVGAVEAKEKAFGRRFTVLGAFLGVVAVNLFFVRTWLRRRSPAA